MRRLPHAAWSLRTIAGNINGIVHSHRFPGANTALPTANEDAAQLKLTEDFLKSGALTVDIFALSPAQRASKAPETGAQSIGSGHHFRRGRRSGNARSRRRQLEAKLLPSPLLSIACSPPLRRGDTVRVDVVVRTKKVGHFFPGGTVDAYDTWLELKGIDDKGQTIFWSGMVEDNGKGPVEKGAHFYRSLQVDAHGNPINKRNAWATRAVVYVRLIPPGAADTVHFRMKIPEKTGNKITLPARLCYRKFAWWGTQILSRVSPIRRSQNAALLPTTTIVQRCSRHRWTAFPRSRRRFPTCRSSRLRKTK